MQPVLERLEDLTLLSTSAGVAGTISGTVWNDQDGDGGRQPSEPGLAGETVFLDLNNKPTLGDTVATVAATSTAITTAPGPLGSGTAAGSASTLQVSGFPAKIDDLQVNMDLANNGSGPVTVGIASPLGLSVGNLPTLFTIQPGEHFVGSFDTNAAAPVTLAARPLAPGTYQPQQAFTDPPAFIYNADPNGTWGLVFFGDPSGLVLNRWSLTVKVPEPSATTDASGRYTLSGVAPGTYQVETVLGPSDIATDPSGDSQTVVVGPGQAVGGVDFGVQPGPDLVGQAFNLSSPATAWGQPITINYTLANRGAGDAPAFDVALLLSSDGRIDASDPPLATIHVDGLASHATTSGPVTFTLPATPPAGFGALTQADVGILIDPTHALTQNVAADGANQGLGIDMAALATAPNQAVTSGTGVRQDPSIAVDPSNPDHLVVAYMDSSLVKTGYAGIGVAVSEDGGTHWKQTSIPLPADVAQGAASPTVQFDGQGHVFVSFMAATFLGPRPALTSPSDTETPDGFQSNNGIFVTRSDDGGLSWGTPVAVVSHDYGKTPVFFEDNPSLAVDTFKTLPDGAPNPYFGDLYATWTRFYPDGQFPGTPSSVGGNDVMFAVSSDGGKTWTTVMQTPPGSNYPVTAIEDPFNAPTGTSGTGYDAYSHLAIGPEGDVYVAIFDGGLFAVYHSGDGGSTFASPDYNNVYGFPFYFNLIGPAPTLSTGNPGGTFPDQFRTNPVRQIVADPSHPGRVYVVEANAVNGPSGNVVDPGEIVFASSNDYGLTWEDQFQVGNETTNLATLPPAQGQGFLSVLNDDNGGNDVANDTPQQLGGEAIGGQALPRLSVDAQGHLTVIWYDTRRDPSGQNLDVFGTVSSDGGKVFTPNFRVSDTSFNPNAGAFTDATKQLDDYLGDQVGLASANGVAYAVWTDTRSGSQQIEFARYATSQAPQPPLDRLYPNGTPQSATDLGQVSAQATLPRLTVGSGNDNWFRFQAGASGELVVSATATSGGGGDIQIALADAQGNVLPAVVTGVQDQSGTVIGSQLVYPSVSGQTYLVHVSTRVASAGIAYQLSYGSLTADLGTSVEGAASGTLAAGGQDIYRVEAGVTGSLALTLTPGSDAQGNLAFQVLSGGQTVLASGPSTGSAAGVPQSIRLPVSQGQALLIEVSGGGDPNAQGSFTLGYTNLDQYETNGVASLFVPTPGGPSSIVAADLSGNGKSDLVVSSTNISDPVSVLMGNGDGTFQAPRQFDVGPGLNNGLTAGNRQIGVADLTGNGVPDLIVPNFRGADVSVLLGNGDGTFQPQRRFDAVPSPDSLVTGDFNGDGKADAAVLQNYPQFGGVSKLAILIGRGDGTFEPATTYPTVFTDGAGPMVVGDFTGSGKSDIIVFSKNQAEAQIFLGNGDGTFRDGGTFAVGENVFNAKAVDLLGNGKLDLITTGTNSGDVYVQLGNGDGTFQPPQAYQAMAHQPGDTVGVAGLAVVDFGSPPPSDASSTAPGPPDGHLDLVVTAQSRSGIGPAEVIMLPGLVDAQGKFAGFGAPVVLADIAKAGNIATGDFAGDGATDLAIADVGGVEVIYGKPETISANDTPGTARDLGSVAHLVTLPQAIVTGHEDAYYTYKVPTEAAPGGGAEVVDFSALFQDTGGAGIQMEVLDASGTRLGSGDRFRVAAAQGSVLTIHVFGLPATGSTRGDGVYTLAIDVLPQLVSVRAESPLPGGPATSLVLTFQGDRLDPAAAEDPANYTVIWHDPNGTDTQVIPIGGGAGQAIVYDPSANIEVESGLYYPTAVSQTVTLLFDQALPAGTYEIKLSPKIVAADYNANESALLAGDASFAGHPVQSVVAGTLANGVDLTLPGLVSPASTPGDPSAISKGTPFLAQLPGDLSAFLDQLIAEYGDSSSITAELNAEINARFAPAIAAAGSGTSAPTFTIVWFDPVSLDLQAPQGPGVSYSLQSNQVAAGQGQTFVSVGGTVEVVVMANAAGTFNLDVSNVPAAARGGAVLLGANSSQELSFTDALRGGNDAFTFNVEGSTTTGPGTTGSGGGTGGIGGEGGGSGSGNDGSGGGSSPGGSSPGGSSPGLASTIAATVTPLAHEEGSAGGQASVSFSQQAALTLISAVLIGGPVGSSTTASSSGTTAAAPGQPGVAAVAGGVPIPTPINAANAARAANAAVNQDLLLQLGNRLLNGTVPVFMKPAVELLKGVGSRLSVILEALGWKPKSPAAIVWKGLLKVLSQSGAAPATAAGRNAPAQAQGGQRPAGPSADAAPSPGPGAPGTVWDRGLEGLLRDRDDLRGPAADGTSRETSATWAALLVIAGAYHAKARGRAEADEDDLAEQDQ